MTQDECLSGEKSLHPVFNGMTGRWEGRTRTWFEPDVLADESPCSGEFRPVAGGNFLLWEYTGSIQGGAFTGMAMIAYDGEEQAFQTSWIDSFHMSGCIMFSTGKAIGAGFFVTGSYSAGPGNNPWGWRMEFLVPGDGSLVICSFNISPEGEESLAIETVLFRSLSD
jgi:hypothetical protein